MNLFSYGLNIHAVIVKNYTTFKYFFQGLSSTLALISRTFQLMEFSIKKIQDFPGGVETLSEG